MSAEGLRYLRWCWPAIFPVAALSVGHAVTATSGGERIEAVSLEMAAADPSSGDDSFSRAGAPGTTVVLLVTIDQGRVLALDEERSEILRLADDRGMDLLAAGERIEEARSQGPSGNHASLSFGGGIANGMELTRVTDDGAGVVTLRSLALPSTGAVGLQARGRMTLTVGRDVVTENLPNVELKAGTVLKLGDVNASLRSSGSAQSWRLASDAPLDAVVEVQAIGPDGNPTGGTFASGNTKGFFTEAGVTRVTLRVKRYREVTERELPFDLTVGLGFRGYTQSAPIAPANAVATTSSAHDIQVAELEVAAADPASGDPLSPTRRLGTTVVLRVSTDHGRVLALDAEESEVAALTDDRGTDLLAAGRRIEEAKSQGRSEGGVSFGGGIANGMKLTRVTNDGAGVVTLRSLALPTAGAAALRARGRLAVTVGNVVTDELKNVELKAGTVVYLGKAQARLRPSGSTESSSSWSFDPPLEAVTDVEAIGPGEQTFGGGNSKGFFTAPGATRVTLRVKRHGDVTRQELPFDLIVGLGFGGHTQSAAAAAAIPSVMATACVNPYYFPAADGGRWIYQETRSVKALGGRGDGETPTASRGTTSVVRQPISEASFREQTRLRGEGSESSSSGEWSCQEEGLRPSGALDLVAMLVSLDDLGPWVDTGVDVPRAAAWRHGAKWRHVAEANSSQGSEAAAKHITVSNSCEIVASEQVTVPAGTYEAFRVECTATVDAEGSERNGRLLTAATTAWHAHGVGIVKSRTLSTFGGSGSGAAEGIRMERTIALKGFTGIARR